MDKADLHTGEEEGSANTLSSLNMKEKAMLV